jgi:hypothetical protein
MIDLKQGKPETGIQDNQQEGEESRNKRDRVSLKR